MAFPYKKMTEADFERIREITAPERVTVGADIPEDYFHDEMPEYGVFPPEHYVFYQKAGGHHDFDAVQEFMFNALPLFFGQD